METVSIGQLKRLINSRNEPNKRRQLERILISRKTTMGPAFSNATKCPEIFSAQLDHMLAQHLSLIRSGDTISKTEDIFGSVQRSGTFGNVYQCECRGQKVAVKVLRVSVLDKKEEEEFRNNTRFMFENQHSNVVAILGVCYEKRHYAMVMEFLQKGDLFHLLQKETLKLEDQYHIAIDVGRALDFLHGKYIVHSSLKSTNVLITLDYGAKVADFGMSKVKVACSTTSPLCDQPNPVCWLAPELLNQLQEPNYKSDIYSYGMILWELSSGQIPFKDVAENELDYHVESGSQEKINRNWRFASVIEKCWCEPNSRLTASEVVEQVQLCK